MFRLVHGGGIAWPLGRRSYDLAIDAGELPGHIGEIGDERHLSMNLTPFRARPVWRYNPEHYLCIDPCFIVEKLASRE
jgi:hypothetical protein